MSAKRAIAAASSLLALVACTTVLNIDDGSPPPSLDGGTADGNGERGAVVATGLAEVTDLVVFGEHVYFARSTTEAAIVRVPKRGGEPEIVVSGGLVTSPSNLAVTPAGIFWGGAPNKPTEPGLRFYDGIAVQERPGNPGPSWVAARADHFFFITQEDPSVIWSGNPFVTPSAIIENELEHAIKLATDGKYLFIATESPASDPVPPPRVIRVGLDGSARIENEVGSEPVTALTAAPGRAMWASPRGVFTVVPEQLGSSEPTEQPQSISSVTDAVSIVIDERFLRFYFVAKSGRLYTGAQGVTTVELSTGLPCPVGHAVTRDDTDLYVACGTTILRVPLLH